MSSLLDQILLKIGLTERADHKRAPIIKSLKRSSKRGPREKPSCLNLC